MIRPRRKLRRGELTNTEKGIIRHQVYVRDRGECADCTKPVIEESGYWSSMHLAHIRSRGAGGDWSLTNLKTLCMACHLIGAHNPKSVPPKSDPSRGLEIDIESFNDLPF